MIHRSSQASQVLGCACRPARAPGAGPPSRPPRWGGARERGTREERAGNQRARVGTVRVSVFARLGAVGWRAAAGAVLGLLPPKTRGLAGGACANTAMTTGQAPRCQNCAGCTMVHGRAVDGLPWCARAMAADRGLARGQRE